MGAFAYNSAEKDRCLGALLVDFRAELRNGIAIFVGKAYHQSRGLNDKTVFQTTCGSWVSMRTGRVAKQQMAQFVVRYGESAVLVQPLCLRKMATLFQVNTEEKCCDCLGMAAFCAWNVRTCLSFSRCDDSAFDWPSSVRDAGFPCGD